MHIRFLFRILILVQLTLLAVVAQQLLANDAPKDLKWGDAVSGIQVSLAVEDQMTPKQKKYLANPSAFPDITDAEKAILTRKPPRVLIVGIRNTSSKSVILCSYRRGVDKDGIGIAQRGENTFQLYFIHPLLGKTVLNSYSHGPQDEMHDEFKSGQTITMEYHMVSELNDLDRLKGKEIVAGITFWDADPNSVPKGTDIRTLKKVSVWSNSLKIDSN
jgi:hypothetical protein